MNAIGCTLVLSAAAVAATPPPASQRIDTVLQDDAQLLYRSPSQVNRSLDRMARLGVDRVRLTASWRRLEPARGRWDRDALARLDRAVDGSRRRGMKPMVDLGFFAPAWAVTRPAANGQRNVWRPSVPAFAAFTRVLAKRYRGRVRLWTTWNEPNNWVFLQPQTERGRPVSPGLYRRLHEAAYRQLRNVSPRNRVLIGGLASRGSSGPPGPRKGIGPLAFTRALACVDDQLRPLTTPDCRGFKPLQADGFAIHPYSRGTTPDANDPARDRVQIGELGKLTTLLAQLRQRGRLARPLPLWITEYGYDTNPPDPRGVSEGVQAGYANLALLLAQQAGARSFPQFLLRDIGAVTDYQTGLYTASGRPKRALLQAFTLPFAVAGPYAVGQVRPGRGGQGVTLERRSGGRWSRVACLATDTQGSYRVPLPGPGTYRAVWRGRPSGTAVSR